MSENRRTWAVRHAHEESTSTTTPGTRAAKNATAVRNAHCRAHSLPRAVASRYTHRAMSWMATATTRRAR
ncbi:beta-phosphoglucomutase-like phosphatase (HAD superfamily) [Halarchaeum solikamskense]|uniref:hypothetical protein n=1 Tax=Halarchaeum nitratireducens TaxID=489913 RepID=UPI001B3ABF96|nr:hypothetical protein [Halarchaeum solikamskense]MBP2252189.1 beta-phosphoglucomutase-like phosphatase (HAD superfamily) [Halarchaeum solikamskense]